MSANGIKIAFGGASWLFNPVEEVTEWLKILEENGIEIIDTAQLYGASEETMGKAGAASRFTVDTKMPGGFSDQLCTKDVMIDACKTSLKKLNTDSVDVYYIHAPDRRVPVKETLSGLNELYKQGAFKRLGLSNFLGDEVEEIVRVAKENNFVVPSVYQGNYSAVARRADDEIFPIIRRHKMAFYAYSPIAGGFLSKSKAQLTEADGRFGEGQPLAKVYNGMYNRPSFVAALDDWEQIAKEENVSRAELAYRWVVYHSKLQGNQGDVIIVGARNIEQFKQTIQALKAGPLSDGAVKKIDQVWESVKAEASLDNYEMLSSR
ncbi:putative oxidoreductase [Lentithecium fluviatile CBS 122367]|uniref:Putative oxidoreductase n=1 Tax=Lentithecium fluviatile CBS 122367 TaxID=1168545 RepID=A0A6G1IKN3_9PLEO|nr:putative oxidoreductase [Lentithecium fluviatile CBS 122367]